MKSSMSKKYIIKNAIDLANPMLGTKITNCSDEFFAPATRIINPLPPIFKENAFDNHGKWMDGWETRRRRSKGNDYLVIKLGKPGKIQLVDVDTTYFNGNQPEYAQLEGCFSKNNKLKNIKWIKITNKSKIKPNHNNILKSKSSKTFNFVRLNIYPDGGVARLRLLGNIDLFNDHLFIIRPDVMFNLTACTRLKIIIIDILAQGLDTIAINRLAVH